VSFGTFIAALSLSFYLEMLYAAHRKSDEARALGDSGGKGAAPPVEGVPWLAGSTVGAWENGARAVVHNGPWGVQYKSATVNGDSYPLALLRNDGAAFYNEGKAIDGRFTASRDEATGQWSLSPVQAAVVSFAAKAAAKRKRQGGRDLS